MSLKHSLKDGLFIQRLINNYAILEVVSVIVMDMYLQSRANVFRDAFVN